MTDTTTGTTTTVAAETIHTALARHGVQIYEVGGAVRDRIMGLPSHDIDFTAVVDTTSIDIAPDYSIAFTHLHAVLTTLGFTIFLSTSEYGTIRAHFPRGDTTYGKLTADFVLARKDGPSSDGRRPDYVLPGTLLDDLARRDYTCNAIAMDSNGDLIDPFNGLQDIKDRVLRTVGGPMARFREDGLRSLRAIRFAVTKNMEFYPTLRGALQNFETPKLLAGVSEDRRRDELEKALRHDTVRTLEVLHNETSPEFIAACFSGRLRLSATLKDA